MLAVAGEHSGMRMSFTGKSSRSPTLCPIEFDVELDDGRIAHCWKAQSQPYLDCEFSAGLVEGVDPDVLYLRLDREKGEPLTLFLRPDELQAIIWVATGALWSLEIQKRALISDGNGEDD
jgi:hypothetical protein